MHGGSTQAPWRADGHGDAHTDCAWKVRTQNPKLSPQDPFPVPSDRGASDVLPHDPDHVPPLMNALHEPLLTLECGETSQFGHR